MIEVSDSNIVTKSQQVELFLKKNIRQGNWAPGERISPEREILKQLRVSRATLREAMTRLVSEGLIERKQGAGTFVSRSINMATIGVASKMSLLASHNRAYFKVLVEKANQFVSRAGYQPELLVIDGDKGSVLQQVNPFKKIKKLNGMAGVLSTCWIDKLHEEQLTNGGINVVSVLATPSSGYCVVLDYPGMIREAKELLESHGCDDFAIMYLGEENNKESEFDEKFNLEINQAISEALNGNKSREVRVRSLQSYEETCEKFKQLWFSEYRPQVMVFTDDVLCDRALRVIQELGIRVPEDLGIVTLASAGRKFQFPVPLTRLEFNPNKIISTAWSMLEKLINNEDIDEKVIRVQPELQEGESL